MILTKSSRWAFRLLGRLAVGTRFSLSAGLDTTISNVSPSAPIREGTMSITRSRQPSIGPKPPQAGGLLVGSARSDNCSERAVRPWAGLVPALAGAVRSMVGLAMRAPTVLP